MRKSIVPALAIAALIAGPALAQQSQTGQQPQQMQMKQGMQKTGDQGAKQWDRKSVKDQLEKAGFNNVQVLDTTFLVSAEVHDGQQVLMVVNPPAAAGSAASGSTTGSGGNTAAGAEHSGSGSAKQQ